MEVKEQVYMRNGQVLNQFLFFLHHERLNHYDEVIENSAPF